MFPKIRILGFKTVVDVTLELGQPNVLIGPNGSGKTNILPRDAAMDLIMLHLLFTFMLLLHLWTPPLVGVENISKILDAPHVRGLAERAQHTVLSGSGHWQVLWATQRGEVLCVTSPGLQESGQAGSGSVDQLAARDALHGMALLPESYIEVLSAIAHGQLIRDIARERGMGEGTAWSRLRIGRVEFEKLLAGRGWRKP